MIIGWADIVVVNVWARNNIQTAWADNPIIIGRADIASNNSLGPQQD